ncbi:histidine kinase [uncultured Fibrella sp.]|uniref:histidine kinase n=1 Tax=uncultured Fibrella sp. TaxID=1284596 RepID=UPI0035CC2560
MLLMYRLLLLPLMCCLCAGALMAQSQRRGTLVWPPLPTLDLERRGNQVYVDSLVQLGLAQLRRLPGLPKGYATDTLMLYTLSHLATVYRTRTYKSDSSLYYATKLIALAQREVNVKYELKGYLATEFYYRAIQTNYAEALKINRVALELIQKTRKEEQDIWRFELRLGEIYMMINDLPKAMGCFERGLVGLHRFPTSTAFPVLYESYALQQIGLAHKQAGRLEEAESYFFRALELVKDLPQHRTNLMYMSTTLGEFYADQNQPAQAIIHFRVAEKYQKQLNLGAALRDSWSWLATEKWQLHETDSAVYFAEKTLKGRSLKLSRRRAHLVLSQVNESLKNWEQANFHYKQHIALRDSLETDRRLAQTEALAKRWDLEKIELQNQQAEIVKNNKLATFQKQRQLERLREDLAREQLIKANKANDLRRQTQLRQLQADTKQDQLRQESRIALLRNNADNDYKVRVILLLFLVPLLVLATILLSQNRRIRRQRWEIHALNRDLESKIDERTQELQQALGEQVRFQQKEAEFQQLIAQSEISALRAQMNPHFIFNCLNSIQYYTAQNDAETASDYLTKFSRLIRLVLENSRSERVTLANELETLRLYIEMEAMRFQQKVSYRITVAPSISTEFIQIPPLLLQPFVENAIWHGLMHKEEGGTVQIAVGQPDPNRLCISITDDGVGRAKAAEYKSKSATRNKSFGLQLTADRIKLINQLYQTYTQIQVNDLTDEQGEPTGTRVIIDIPI